MEAMANCQEILFREKRRMAIVPGYNLISVKKYLEKQGNSGDYLKVTGLCEVIIFKSAFSSMRSRVSAK